MIRTSRRTSSMVVTGAAVLLLTGCASYTDIPGSVAVSAPGDVAMAFLDDVGSGDAEGACDHLSTEAAGIDADDCPDQMRDAMDAGLQEDTDSWEVADVTEDGSSSEVQIEDESGEVIGSVFLGWEDGRWKVTSL